jgi:hypothetical protein
MMFWRKRGFYYSRFEGQEEKTFILHRPRERLTNAKICIVDSVRIVNAVPMKNDGGR